MWYLYNLAYIYVVLMYILIYCLKSEKRKLWVYAEISDLHVGRQSPLRWKKLENFKLELPRDTLLSVEIVQELKGEVNREN